MGYTTEFIGKFEINKKLDKRTYNELIKINRTRHEDEDAPGIWCQWVPTKDGKFLEWDGGEKFYEYEEWLHWLIENVLTEYTLNGIVGWMGENKTDIGMIKVKDNKIYIKNGQLNLKQITHKEG